MNDNPYIKALESTGKLSEPAIRNAIKSLNLTGNQKILDVPCGTGTHMRWMFEEYPKLHITGFDIAKEHLEYAKEKLHKDGNIEQCKFVQGDMNQFDFADNSFDIVWCCDGLWPGPKEMGCPVEEPYQILNDMVRVTKNDGTIAILFWSSQKLLPGYPFLEAKLNATKSAIMPVNPDTNPDLHFMSTLSWMRKAGLNNIQSRTFATDFQAPISESGKEGLLSLFNMFWANSEAEVSKEIWDKYKQITNPESGNYILNSEDYTGFLTYTMFTGKVFK